MDLLRANRERSRNLNELADTLRIYFQPIQEYDLIGVKKYFHEAAASRLLEAASALALVEPFIAPRIEAVYRALMVEMNIKGGDLIHPTRLAISGKTVGPSLFELMQLVGRAECMVRMQNAAQWIANQDSTQDSTKVDRPYEKLL